MANNKLTDMANAEASKTPQRSGIIGNVITANVPQSKVEDKVATFRIREDLLQEFKEYAVGHKMKQKEVLEAALIAYMTANP